MPLDRGRDDVGNAPIETPTLVAGRWRLRPIAEADTDFMFATMNDPGMVRARTAPPPADEATVLAWIRRAIAASAAGTSATWIVVDSTAEDQPAVGLSVLQEIDRANAVAEAGYFVAEPFRGSGVATGCLRTVTEWAFDELDLERVQLFHDIDNPASCRVAERAGYATEGILRSSRRRHDGSRADQEIHARLRDGGRT